MPNKLLKKISQLPRTPGVYLFYGQEQKILYIGKATSLRDRVRSYFSLRDERGERIANMVSQIVKIETQKTDSVLEALILEANLIKKYQPKYNVERKDDKSFSYFVVTKEKFPRVLIIRESEIKENRIQNSKLIIHNSFGPYTSKKNMEVALNIIRKIFPFHALKAETEKGCLDFQIGKCPGPHAGAISRADYLQNIRGIKMILEGKKKDLVKRLEKEMRELAQKHEFEKAAELRNKVFALQHIRDVALISDEGLRAMGYRLQDLRIEAYDISNISGKNAEGSMVFFKDKEPDKAQYRKFKIKTVAQADDVGMMREVLLRRFSNSWPASTRGEASSSTRGWPKPDLILLDGGVGHLNMGLEILSSFKLDIPLVAVAKGATRKKNEIILGDCQPKAEIKSILDDANLVKRIMDEAHRFAITYHKKLRKKGFL
jgi:excinuclease ABC subunit C